MYQGTRPWHQRRSHVLILSFVAILALLQLKIASDRSYEVDFAHLQSKKSHIEYSAVTGFFLQDDPSTDPDRFDFVTSSLGLIDQEFPTDEVFDPDHKKPAWERFEFYLRHLNADADPNVQYKLFYIGRHGQGYHNVAEAYYGEDAWNCYWSMLDGNGTVVWKDPKLTEFGLGQAKRANQFWKDSLKKAKLPPPQSYYSSPLGRCLTTANITYGDLDLPSDRPFAPHVKELFREAVGIHTCDERSRGSEIEAAFPNFDFEPDFAEEDPLWTPDLRESNSHLYVRLKDVLDDVVRSDPATFVSITSHSGAIAMMLHVLGHIPFVLQTGGIIPVFVKATTVASPPPTVTVKPGVPPPTCTANPTPTA